MRNEDKWSPPAARADSIGLVLVAQFAVKLALSQSTDPARSALEIFQRLRVFAPRVDEDDDTRTTTQVRASHTNT